MDFYVLDHGHCLQNMTSASSVHSRRPEVLVPRLRVSMAVGVSTTELSEAAAPCHILSSDTVEFQFLCPLQDLPLPIFNNYS